MATISPIFNFGFTKAETPADFHFFGLQRTKCSPSCNFGFTRDKAPTDFQVWFTKGETLAMFGSEKNPLLEFSFAWLRKGSTFWAHFRIWRALSLVSLFLAYFWILERPLGALVRTDHKSGLSNQSRHKRQNPQYKIKKLLFGSKFEVIFGMFFEFRSSLFAHRFLLSSRTYVRFWFLIFFIFVSTSILVILVAFFPFENAFLASPRFNANKKQNGGCFITCMEVFVSQKKKKMSPHGPCRKRSFLQCLFPRLPPQVVIHTTATALIAVDSWWKLPPGCRNDTAHTLW